MRLLIKMRPGQGLRSLALGGTTLKVKAPLMPSVEAGRRPGAAAAAAWHLAEVEAVDGVPLAGRDQPNAWDICHRLVGQGLGAVGGTIEFAEPDLEQHWISDDRGRQAFALARSCDQQAPQSSSYPPGPSERWFGEETFSQLYAAAAAVGDPGNGRLRIAHLDTGYDPDQVVKPPHISTPLQRNFIDAEFPNDARDRSASFIKTLGHGTGTLGILAGTWQGRPLGGAAHLEIVPIRVADLVVLFSNGAIAQAFDYVHSLAGGPNRIDVITLSMGGVPSQAWADAVNALYDSGVVVVAAAGNNFGNLPTSSIVYPARFNRVVAACGVMANGDPYADLGLRRMAGNYGPATKMRTAIAACTPNIPWARFGCKDTVDLDGGGTSSATPQVAAAAALWLQKHKAKIARYSQSWMRVEAARRALFKTAQPQGAESGKYFGTGLLRANAALSVDAAAESELKREPADEVSFPILRLLFGRGVAAAPDARIRMLEIEAAQLAAGSQQLQAALARAGDPTTATSLNADTRAVLEALAGDPAASAALRRHIRSGLGIPPRAPQGTSVTALAAGSPPPPAVPPPEALHPPVPEPAVRRLRVYAQDPLSGTKLDTLHLNEATLRVPWEDKLQPGPVGEYLEVVDIDPTNDAAYAPVDLNQPSLLSQDGMAPSEGLPQFHQQMVYAVAMKTIHHFERALGRVALWSPRRIYREGDNGARGHWRQSFVRRLRIYPHALREANAYYSPDKKALLFGYFPASLQEAGQNLPGGMIFTCLAHDVIAHETTHALLDGLHPRFGEATNPDMLAFHEAFADIVALMQHFTMPETLKDAIRKTRGDLTRESSLGELAVQFGQAIAQRGALRDAIGRIDRDTGEWVPRKPSRADYNSSSESHARGAVLVAAVFDAFLQVYRHDTRNLFRLATSGTGILPEGEIPALLVDCLAVKAAEIADRVLEVCIRALDYCPPVDLTFGDYLRALITADRDVAAEESSPYRAAFIDAFRSRGIYPEDVNSMSEESLSWEKPQLELQGLEEPMGQMTLNWRPHADRLDVYNRARNNAVKLHDWLVGGAVPDAVLRSLGLRTPSAGKTPTLEMGPPGYFSKLEIHSVRPARRLAAGRQPRIDLVVEITQKWKPADDPNMFHRGGCTLLIDLEKSRVRYVVRKRVDSTKRMSNQQAFKLGLSQSQSLGVYFGTEAFEAEPFAITHRHM